jgi:hypothetical protein
VKLLILKHTNKVVVTYLVAIKDAIVSSVQPFLQIHVHMLA